MDKKRAVELLIQVVDEIPYLKTLRYKNDEFQLWLKKVENIIRVGFEPEDQKKYWEASQFLKYLRGAHEENLMQQDYLNEVIRYEIALKSIIQKYEILGIEGEGDKGGEVEMSEAENQEIIDELKNFYKKLRSYQNRQHRRLKEDASEAKDRSLNALRLELQRDHGRLYRIISKYGGEGFVPILNNRCEVFGYALNNINLPFRGMESLDAAINLVNRAIGAMESQTLPEAKIRSLMSDTEETVKSPLIMFDSMQFHPKVVESSRKLFKDGHYRDAIYRAFVEVNNFVKRKANSQLDGKRLMSTVFSLDNPVIKLNSLQTQSDRDEQEGFMFLFMGAMEGIRNPKAHENILQYDLYRTLEYLGLASLLMKRAEEGSL